MPLPIIVLLCVFVAIALRRFIRFRLQIWHIMLIGALLVLLTGQTSPTQAFQSINWEVIFYLFGVFVIGRGLEKSGYLSKLSFRVLKRIKSAKHLLFISIFIFAFSSALLMNDTIAIIGTSTILLLTKQQKRLAKPLLLGLAVSITLGSVLTPVGNPQNLLIASSGYLPQPFIEFFVKFILPTLINLVAAYALIYLFYRKTLSEPLITPTLEPIAHPRLAKIATSSVVLLVILIVLKIIFGMLHQDHHLTFSLIAILSCLPILLFSKHRTSILRSLDWESLVFFISMFVLMGSVWHSGYFQKLMETNHLQIQSTIGILLISVLLSQLVSNLPLVALYLPILIHAGVDHNKLLALAAGSTIAGNLFLLGAASNIIIIQTAEKRMRKAFHFFEFSKLGLPLTIINMAVFFVFLKLLVF